jgi:hypothetical protein
MRRILLFNGVCPYAPSLVPKSVTKPNAHTTILKSNIFWFSFFSLSLSAGLLTWCQRSTSLCCQTTSPYSAPLLQLSSFLGRRRSEVTHIPKPLWSTNQLHCIDNKTFYSYCLAAPSFLSSFCYLCKDLFSKGYSLESRPSLPLSYLHSFSFLYSDLRQDEHYYYHYCTTTGSQPGR